MADPWAPFDRPVPASAGEPFWAGLEFGKIYPPRRGGFWLNPFGFPTPPTPCNPGFPGPWFGVHRVDRGPRFFYGAPITFRPERFFDDPSVPPANFGDSPDAQLLRAAKAGDFASIDRSLEDGANINAKILPFYGAACFLGESGVEYSVYHGVNLTALQLAILYKHWDVAVRLLKEDDIDVEPKTGCIDKPILLLACSSHYGGSVDLVEKLRSRGCDMFERHDDGSTVFHVCCGPGDDRDGPNCDILRYLLDCGYNPNVTDNYGVTPLHRACLHPGDNRHELVELLLDRGIPADVRARTAGHETPMHLAALHASIRTVGLLLDRGARVEDKDVHNRTALHRLMRRTPFPFNGAATIVDELIRRGSPILDRDSYGNTPLDLNGGHDMAERFLTEYRNQVVAQHRSVSLHYILQHTTFEQQNGNQAEGRRLKTQVGTLTMEEFATLVQPFLPDSIRTRDENGKLPLHIAAGNGAPVEVLDMFMFRGACRVADHTETLPVHCACETLAPLPVIRYLVEAGGVATVRKRDLGGRLPLHASLQGDSNNLELAVVQYLVSEYPDSLNARTVSGDTPLTLAGEFASLSIINFLVRQNPGALSS